MKSTSIALLASLFLGACAGDPSSTGTGRDEEYGMDGDLLPTSEPGKEDSQNRRGLLVATDTSRTQSWSARNKWEDTTTTAAKAAGVA